ncbi:hypothetical protein [Selenomonas sp. F0473]|uniref:hypothetical protein n=1 Tax=Selenomonas sp. F0473 TaxID=999423 RepID=UPI0025EFCBD0|nr:hypothetical protein [Selenomonas sp. F0473]
MYIIAFILLLVGKRLLQTIVWYRRGEASGAALMCTVGVFGSVLIALVPFVIRDLALVPGYDFESEAGQYMLSFFIGCVLLCGGLPLYRIRNSFAARIGMDADEPTVQKLLRADQGLYFFVRRLPRAGVYAWVIGILLIVWGLAGTLMYS